MQAFKFFKPLGHLHSLEYTEQLLYMVRQELSHISTGLVKVPMNLLTHFNKCKKLTPHNVPNNQKPKVN